MYQSENINELASALSKAQGEFVPALKDSANPFFKSKYANLCSIVKSCQEPLSKNGLSYCQSTQREDGMWVLLTKLMHSSGQWVSSVTPIITTKSDIQSFGSAVTYARRYALAALAGVTTDEDDDGESAMSRKGSESNESSEANDKKIKERKKLLIGMVGEDNKDSLIKYIEKLKDTFKTKTEKDLFLSKGADEFIKDFTNWKDKQVNIA